MIQAMSIYYPTSTVYRLGQQYSISQDQGSTYLGYSYGDTLAFTPRLSITNPISGSIIPPTAANYPISPNPFFMGSFDGFWIHKLYLGDTLVATVQTVNQDMFVPIQHDRVESVSMGFVMESIPYDGPVRPPVPAPSVLLAIGLGFAILSRKGTRR